MNKANIATMGDEHSAWLRALDFYKQELNIVKNRLTEVAGKNTGGTITKDIEHFENQIKVQVNNIDNLHHAINDNLSRSVAQAKNNAAGYIDSALLTAHTDQHGQYTSLEQTINDLRQEFNRFASKWM